MSALQTINLGTAPTGSDGDPVRTAFTKDNANVAVLQTQETLTSVALITSAQALTTAHIGKRVNINLGSADTINLPAASTCLVDQVTLLRNLGSTIVTLAVTSASGDTLTVSKLNPGESALFDTDGIHTWNCLLRGRTSSDNETVNGNCVVVGNETVGGTLTVTGATILTGGITGGPNFSARPTFASNVPWDSSNLVGPVTLAGTQTLTGTKTFSVRPVFNGATPWDSANLTHPLNGSNNIAIGWSAVAGAQPALSYNIDSGAATGNLVVADTHAVQLKWNGAGFNIMIDGTAITGSIHIS